MKPTPVTDDLKKNEFSFSQIKNVETCSEGLLEGIYFQFLFQFTFTHLNENPWKLKISLTEKSTKMKAARKVIDPLK